MISIIAASLLVFVYVLLECLVKSSPLRIFGSLILIFFVCIIVGNIGFGLGKTQQLNRLSRLLPQAFATLGQVKQRDGAFQDAVNLLRDSSSDPAKLDNFEATLIQLESELNNARPPKK